MRPTLSLIRREFTAYFLSPIAYVVLAVFLLVTGHLFYLTLNLLTETGPRGVEFPMQTMLGDEKFWLVFLFIPPLLTMRLFAEERGSGTLEMLMTAPLRDWQVVFAKFIACFLFYLVMWLPTLVYWPVLVDYHSISFPMRFDIGWNDTIATLIVAVATPMLALVICLLPRSAGLIHLLGQMLLLVGPALAVSQLIDMPGINAILPARPDSGDNILAKVAWIAGVILGPPVVYYLVPYLARRLSGGDNDDSIGFADGCSALFWCVVGGVILASDSYLVFQPVSIDIGIDSRPVGLSYLGVILAGAMFLSMGLFVSSLVRSQMVSALVSLILSLLFIVGGFWRPELDPSSLVSRVMSYVSVPLHFREDFTRGILDTGHLVLYTSTTLFFLFLTVRSLESRRWK